MDVLVGGLQHPGHQREEFSERDLSIPVSVQVLEYFVNDALVFGILEGDSGDGELGRSPRTGVPRPLVPPSSAWGGPGDTSPLAETVVENPACRNRGRREAPVLSHASQHPATWRALRSSRAHPARHRPPSARPRPTTHGAGRVTVAGACSPTLMVLASSLVISCFSSPLERVSK